MPFPANYGGVIDVYYKLKWFKQMGIDVYLHCFAYGRKPSAELDLLCKEVFYYPRKTGIASAFSSLPYTVKSRQSKELEKNLLSNDFPIFFEVLHTCYLLNDDRFKNRIKIYRHSNIEHHYYEHLALSEKNIVKKLYLQREAKKLEKFETVIENANYILAVNEIDADYFQKKYKNTKTLYVPSFHENDQVEIKEGKGNYLLYHGNLSISENYEAAEWLIHHVFSKIKHSVIIAGLNPPDFLIELIKKHDHIQLQQNPDDKKMKELIANAQIHCLFTSQSTGLKLKLLNVLFAGRFLICNNNMLSGTGFKTNKGLRVTDRFIDEIDACFDKDFSNELMTERKGMLDKFSNQRNMNQIVDLIWKD